MFESSQNVLLKPTESWRGALLDGRVMELFFTVSPALSPAGGRGTGVLPDGWTDGLAPPRPPLPVGVAARTDRADTPWPVSEASCHHAGLDAPELTAHTVWRRPRGASACCGLQLFTFATLNIRTGNPKQ